MKSLTDTYTLSNGVKIPCVGFGTWQAENGEQAVNSVKAALKVGYRHIDTAMIYENEQSIGQAIRESGVPRGEIFVTTKLWNADQGYETTLKAFDASMKRLGLDVLDLYLIHWPMTKGRADQWPELNRETWRAMESLYKDGRIRAIGVSNFLVKFLEPLLQSAEIAPMVNQIELHPGFLQKDTVQLCKQRGILVESWAPLSRGKLLQGDTLSPLTQKHNKTPAQIILRWHLQHGLLPLPKSVTPSRIEQNTKIFDFELSTDEMAFMDNLKDVQWSNLDPLTAAF